MGTSKGRRLVSRWALRPAYGVCCALADLTGGNPRVVRAKLRLGAALLGAAGAAAGCSPLTETDGDMCYAAGPPEPDRVILDGAQGATVEVSLSQSTTLTGQIQSRASTEFSFAVLAGEQASTTLQQGALPALDGAMDEDVEEIELTIDPTTPPGSYVLRFYNDGGGAVDRSYIRQLTLVVSS